MTYFTDSSSVSTPLQLVAKLAGAISGWTQYTSRLRSTKITSEHIGVKNEKIAVTGFSLVFVPRGAGTVTISYEMDHKRVSEGSFTIGVNPFSYDILSDAFYLVETAGDEGESLLEADDDRYTVHQQINAGNGKVFEFEIQITGDVQLEILGFEIDMKQAGKQAAYVGGEY